MGCDLADEKTVTRTPHIFLPCRGILYGLERMKVNEKNRKEERDKRDRVNFGYLKMVTHYDMLLSSGAAKCQPINFFKIKFILCNAE